MATEAEMMAEVSLADSDLVYFFEDHGLALALQYSLVHAGFNSLRRFIGLGDAKATFRTAVAAELQLDANTPAGRLSLSVLVGIWDAAGQYTTKEIALRAESKALGIPKVASTTERTAMRKVMENRFGKRESAELPAASYLAEKLSEMEDNEPTAAKLDEIISADDLEVQQMAQGVNTHGLIQMMRTKSKTTLPSDPEQLRLRLKVESNLWLMMQTKFPNRGWLQQLTPEAFDKYTTYLLGRKCHGLMVSSSSDIGESVPLNPPWSLVLQYDYQLRKSAFKQVREDNVSLKEALEVVVKDQELKELHFLTPLAHQAKRHSAVSPPPQPFKEQLKTNPVKEARKVRKAAARLLKQKANGKGKGGGKGKGKAMTPDGRLICGGYNHPQGCTYANCNRVHVCNRAGCLKTEPAHTHH